MGSLASDKLWELAMGADMGSDVRADRAHTMRSMSIEPEMRACMGSRMGDCKESGMGAGKESDKGSGTGVLAWHLQRNFA